MSEQEMVELSVQLHHETEKAILVSDDGEEKNAKWLPKSQISIININRKIAEIQIPEWLAMKNGLI